MESAISITDSAEPSRCSTDSDDAIVLEPQKCHRALFSGHWQAPWVAVIDASGELDATNGESLGIYIREHSHGCQRLVVDLAEVKFFGSAGFSALQTVNVRCAQAGIAWALVPSPAVSKLLKVCDPEHAVPTADSCDAALAGFNGEPQRLLELVREPD